MPPPRQTRRAQTFYLSVYQHDTDRGVWGSKLEELLVGLGSCIGIGSIIRFPYLVYRSGGGAFLIPFALMLVLCGIPLYYLETCIGQFSSTGCISMFRMSPIFKGAGYAMIIVNGICACYYSLIVAYPIRFLVNMFQKGLPWEKCDNSWNTENCMKLEDMSGMNMTNVNFKTPADEFFHLEVLQMSDSIEHLGGYVWPLFFSLLVTWVAIFLSVFQGVKSVGKVSYATVIFPIIVLFMLFARGITLPGAMEGIRFYIQPEWSKLLDLETWSDAAIQIFFSLGPGWGGIVDMASFNDFRDEASWYAVFMPLIHGFASIFGGFVVFSVLGYLSYTSGVPVADVAASGPGLAFIIYPEAIAKMPFPKVWAAAFLMMISFLEIDTVMVQIESITSSIFDEFKALRTHKAYVNFVVCTIFFLLSSVMTTNGGMFVLQLLDWYATAIPVILICTCEVIMVSWIYGIERFMDDIYFMIDIYPAAIWRICWKYLTPVTLILIFFTSIIFNRRIKYNDIDYPDWAIAIGWFSCFISISMIPIYVLYIIMKKKRKNPWRKLKLYSKPHDWTPADEQIRLDYEEFRREQSEKNKDADAT